MKISIYIILVIVFSNLISCQSNLDIKTDFSAFSNKMTNGDTLIINWDLGICDSERNESDLITKRNDSIFISIKGIEDRVEFNYEERFYKFQESDSLNFENLFYKLSQRKDTRERKSKTIQIIFNHEDTMLFYTGGLIEKIYVTNYMWKIKDRIYWDEEFYKPIQIPSEPIGLTEEERLDSVMKSEIKKDLEKIANRNN